MTSNALKKAAQYSLAATLAFGAVSCGKDNPEPNNGGGTTTLLPKITYGVFNVQAGLKNPNNTYGVYAPTAMQFTGGSQSRNILNDPTNGHYTLVSADLESSMADPLKTPVKAAFGNQFQYYIPTGTNVYLYDANKKEVLQSTSQAGAYVDFGSMQFRDNAQAARAELIANLKQASITAAFTNE